jgi:hypothetical protein
MDTTVVEHVPSTSSLLHAGKEEAEQVLHAIVGKQHLFAPRSFSLFGGRVAPRGAEIRWRAAQLDPMMALRYE